MANGSWILLTHWDPGFYEPNADPFCITDVALNALLYDHVSVRAVDLAMNEPIAKRLYASEDDFNLLRELVDYDCVTIFTTAPDNYRDEDLREGALLSPIRARALDQFRHRSHAGQPWRPDEWQWKFIDKLDRAIENDGDFRCIRELPRPPEENQFAARLAEILEEREKYELSGMDQFADIDNAIADAFVVFCTEPDAFKRFLADDPSATPRDEFYRHEAYQCARRFPNPDGMINLVQSVYMGLECERLAVDGRFGRRLWEPPFRFQDTSEKTEALEEARKIELAVRRRAITLALKPGLGKALALTRESSEFRALQAVFKRWEPESPFESMDSYLNAVADKFAECAAKTMLSQSTPERVAEVVAKTLYFGLRSYAVSFHALESGGTNPTPVVDDQLSNLVARLAGKMTHIVRSAAFSRGVAAQVRRALTVRSTTIKF